MSNGLKEIESQDLQGLFPANEGMMAQYFGRIGSGKTYAATSDVLQLLREGKVVYANWKIHYDGTDETKSLSWILLGIFFPFKKRFYNFPKENLYYFEISDKWAKENGFRDFTDWLATRTDCYIFADEGHQMVDSYAGTRMPLDKRMALLHTRHFNRSIYIISQRPTAIHVVMRANVNVFYKCEVQAAIFGFILFKRTEFQDMQGETVDENEEKIISTKFYWGKNSVFNAYDTKYLRGGMGNSQEVKFNAYDIPYTTKVVLLIDIIFPTLRTKLSTAKRWLWG